MRDTFCGKDMTTEPKGKSSKKNWRSKLGVFLKTSRHVRPARTHNKPYRPSPEEVKEWAASLDRLLNSKYGMAAFRIFMKSEYCEENIEFWLACEEFRKIKLRSKRISRAKGIYDEFIKEASPKQINLDYQSKEAIFKSLKSSTKSSFTAAQSKVYCLMENNSYPRFLDSQLYSQICQLAQGTHTESDPSE